MSAFGIFAEGRTIALLVQASAPDRFCSSTHPDSGYEFGMVGSAATGHERSDIQPYPID